MSLAALIGPFIPLLIRAIGMWITHKVESDEIRKTWLLFVETMQARGSMSARLKDEYERQLEALRRDPPPNIGP